jgi:hypothetical protein
MEEDPTLEGHQGQELNEDNAWVDGLQTQPQSPSSSERRVEQNDHAPPHARMGDEVQDRQRVEIVNNFAGIVIEELWEEVMAEHDEEPAPNVYQLQVAEDEEIARQGYLLAAEGYRLAYEGEELEAGVAQGEQLAVQGYMLAAQGYQIAAEGERLATEGYRLIEEDTQRALQLAIDNHAPVENPIAQEPEAGEDPIEQKLEAGEDPIEQEPHPALETIEPDAALVEEPIAEHLAPGSEPIVQEPIPVPEHEHVPEVIAEYIQRHPNLRQQRNTLRYIYEPREPPPFRPCDHLQTFRPAVGHFANGGGGGWRNQ